MTNNSGQPIVVDSSGLISLLVDTDSNHTQAVRIVSSYTFTISRIVIPADVFSETINVLGKRIGHNAAVAAAQEIIQSPLFSIIESDEPLRLRAIEKLKNLPESVSYTDCIVMSLADSWNTPFIFGFDMVFKKHGYQMPSD